MKPKSATVRILLALSPMLIVGGLALVCRALYETAMLGWSILWPIYEKLVRWVGIRPATQPERDGRGNG